MVHASTAIQNQMAQAYDVGKMPNGKHVRLDWIHRGCFSERIFHFNSLTKRLLHLRSWMRRRPFLQICKPNTTSSRRHPITKHRVLEIWSAPEKLSEGTTELKVALEGPSPTTSISHLTCTQQWTLMVVSVWRQVTVQMPWMTFSFNVLGVSERTNKQVSGLSLIGETPDLTIVF